MMKRILLVPAALLLGACASYSGRGLVPGQDSFAEVLRTMGTPAMQWQHPDGSKQLSYPRGPASPESFMVRIGADGKLQDIRNVIVPESFARIQPGMSKAEVLQILGPPAQTVYFAARDELVYDWTYQEMADPAHFLVLFDASKETVRASMIQIDRPPSMY